jgi:hypothetical protein
MARATSNMSFPVSRPLLRPLSTEGSIIPGETEEDGLLRKEYVLVGDTQAVEFNRAVDGKYVNTYQGPQKIRPSHRDQCSPASAPP